MKTLSLKDTVKIGKKKVLVSDLVKEKGKILNLIKDGMIFDDEVLKEANIKRRVRDNKTECVVAVHENETPQSLPKDTKSVKSILKSIYTIEQESAEKYEESEMERKQNYINNLVDEENNNDI